jgi:small subunit ribosomal protein S3
MAKASLSKVVIERTLKRITITAHSSKPGMIIGKGGVEVERIKEELRKLTEKEVHLNILEIKRPEMDAKLVADAIAQQIQARISYKRAIKQALAATMRVGAQGIKIQASGRIGGAEIARSEQFKEGRIPLHTLRADIDYALGEAQTVYGKIGVKVWIFKGEIYQRPDLSANAMVATAAPATNKAPQKGLFKRRDPREQREPRTKS